MENFEFYSKKAFYRANKKSNESFYIKDSIKRINSRIQNIKKSNPNFTLEDLYSILDKDLEEICDAVFASSNVYYCCIQYQCCKYLLENKEKFESVLKTLKNSNSESLPKEFTNDFNENLLIFVNNILDNIIVFDDDYDLSNLHNLECSDSKFLTEANINFFKEIMKLFKDPNLTEKEKDKIYNSGVNLAKTPCDKKIFKLAIDCCRNGPHSYLKHHIQEIELDLKNYLLTSLSSIGNVLDNLDYLKNYPANQEITNIHLGIPDLTYSLDSTSPNNLGVKQMLSKNFLQSKETKTLLALNIFWVNRFAKELDNYIEGIFSCHQLDLFPKILNNSLNIKEINNKDLMTIFNKMNILYFPTCKHLNYLINNPEKMERTDIPDKNYYKLDSKSLIKHNLNTIGNNYFEYFKEYENTSIGNNLSKDLELFWKLYLPVINCYETKDSNMITALDLPNGNNLSFNWGIVLPHDYKEKLSHDKASINLWMDIEGLNLPIRCHIPKKTLTDFLNNSKGNTFFPIYKGSEDFDTIVSKLILPLTKNQISFLKERKKNDFEAVSPKIKNFLKHSYALYNPKEFKKFNPTTTYINLDDLELYSLNKNGEYIPLSTDTRNSDEFY